jgi:transcriptional regulator with XRE-family HTH domain
LVPILKFLANRLKELRRRHELTQEQVATLLGTDLRWYQRIEAAEKDIRATTLDRLARVFGVSAMALLSESLPETKIAALPQKAPHRPKIRATKRPKR